jgi:hypothetical protein
MCPIPKLSQAVPETWKLKKLLLNPEASPSRTYGAKHCALNSLIKGCKN